MEKRNPRKTLPLQTLLFFLYLLLPSTFSRPLHSEPIFSQYPTPSPPSSVSTNTHPHNLRRILLGVLFGSLAGLCVSLLFIFSVRLCLLYANRTPILKGPIVFTPKINPKTLQLAFWGELLSTQSLGSSPNGKYYQVVLDDNLTLAVKRLEPQCSNVSPGLQGSSAKRLRLVQQELEMLARVKHQNLMSLRAYLWDHDRFSLVYDYVQGGSLEDAMKRVRSNQLRLGWEVRHRIAVGVVKGLKHLHFECSPRILHYNLKPKNVLLDKEFEPRLGDSGLARLLGSGIVGGGSSTCYVAPECFQSSSYTDKSDIFSFGVILGLLLTGRDPSDPFFGGEAGGGSLRRWLRHLQQTGEAREVLDKGMLGEEGEDEEMLMAMRIAVVCLSDLPADRPSSDELVAMLTQLHSF